MSLSGQLSLFARPTTATTGDGPPCLKCGHKNTVVSPGVGPHHQGSTARCTRHGGRRRTPGSDQRGGAA